MHTNWRKSNVSRETLCPPVYFLNKILRPSLIFSCNSCLTRSTWSGHTCFHKIYNISFLYSRNAFSVSIQSWKSLQYSLTAFQSSPMIIWFSWSVITCRSISCAQYRWYAIFGQRKSQKKLNNMIITNRTAFMRLIHPKFMKKKCSMDTPKINNATLRYIVLLIRYL